MSSYNLANVFLPKINVAMLASDLSAQLIDISNTCSTVQSINSTISTNVLNLNGTITALTDLSGIYHNNVVLNIDNSSSAVSPETAYQIYPRVQLYNGGYVREVLDNSYAIVNKSYVDEQYANLIDLAPSNLNSLNEIATVILDISNSRLGSLATSIASTNSSITTLSGTVTTNKSLADASFVSLTSLVSSNKSLADASFVSLTSSLGTLTSAISLNQSAIDASYVYVYNLIDDNKALVDASFVDVEARYNTLSGVVTNYTAMVDVSYVYLDTAISSLNNEVDNNKSLADLSFVLLTTNISDLSGTVYTHKSQLDASINSINSTVSGLSSTVTTNKSLMDASFQSVYTKAETLALNNLTNYYVKTRIDASFQSVNAPVYDGTSDINLTSYNITTTTGKIGPGYGAVPPTYALDVSGEMRVTGASYLNSAVIGKTAASAYTLDVSGTVKVNNYMYIGETDPSRNFPLFVGTSLTNGYVESGYGYYKDQNYSASLGASTGTTEPVSIYTTGSVWSLFFLAYSDRRMKRNIEDVSGTVALTKLRDLAPKQYEYIDKYTNVTVPVYGFIAQDVSAVIPSAVSRQKQVVPNFYTRCSVNGGGYNIASDIDISFCPLTDPSWNGTSYTVTLYDISNAAYKAVVTDVIDSSNITISTPLAEGRYFLYGQEVDDFHALNKDEIFTVNVSATIELDRQLQIMRETLGLNNDTDYYIRDANNDLVSTYKSKTVVHKRGSGRLNIIFRINENIAVGDYLTSYLGGFGILQNDDDVYHSYTYARALEAKTYADIGTTVVISGTTYRYTTIDVEYL